MIGGIINDIFGLFKQICCNININAATLMLQH